MFDILNLDNKELAKEAKAVRAGAKLAKQKIKAHRQKVRDNVLRVEEQVINGKTVKVKVFGKVNGLMA